MRELEERTRHEVVTAPTRTAMPIRRIIAATQASPSASSRSVESGAGSFGKTAKSVGPQSSVDPRNSIRVGENTRKMATAIRTNPTARRPRLALRSMWGQGKHAPVVVDRHGTT